MATAPSNWIAQFRGLSMDNVGSWPMLPKLGLWVAVVIVCAIVGWFVVWNDQLNQVNQSVLTLEKQLPSKAEMDALLSDINQAGIGRGLQFELFRPGQVVLKDYYAELPITVRVSGHYHALGAFTSDIANLPRIVTLNNLNVQTIKSSQLSLDAVAKTFRYLDEDEVSAQRKARAPKAGGK